MGVQTLSFLRIQHRPRVPPQGGDSGSWDNYFLPSPSVPAFSLREGQRGRSSSCQEEGPIIIEKNGSWDVKQIAPGQEQ